MPVVTNNNNNNAPATLRVQKGRTALVLDHPFFGSLLFRLKGVESRSVKTMATDGITLYYNPDFVDTLNAATLAGTLAHEVMHPALHHHVRRSGRDPKQRNIETLIDRKYAEAVEVGWVSGSPGQNYRLYRAGMWRDDTKDRGSGYGGGFGFDYELSDGWTPFGRFAYGTRSGTAIKGEYGIGLAQVHPFGRRGDMFGAVFNHTEPNVPAKHHESVFESFYRLRITQSVELGPDIEVSIHPAYAAKAYTTTVLGARMRIIF